MKTVFLLLAQFESATLTIDQVRVVLGGKAAQTIRNRVSAGTFPRPTEDGIWMIQDVADWLDAQKVSACAPMERTSAAFPESLKGTVSDALATAIKCDQPVVYLLLDKGEVVYVGMSRSHITRLYQHRSRSEKIFDSVAMIACSAEDVAKLERQLIAMLSPRYNVFGVLMPEARSESA